MEQASKPSDKETQQFETENIRILEESYDFPIEVQDVTKVEELSTSALLEELERRAKDNTPVELHVSLPQSLVYRVHQYCYNNDHTESYGIESLLKLGLYSVHGEE